MSPWIDVPREADGPLHKKPVVALRTKAVAFNASFTRIAEIKKHKFVAIKVDPDLWRLGFQFHSDDSDQSALTIARDGGQRGHKRRNQNNLAVQTNALMTRHPWVAAVARQKDATLRRFIPEFSTLDKLWIITLRPSFERAAQLPQDLPSEMTGIYRYVVGDEVIYIGKGNIRERAMDSSRREWKYDRIEYSRVANDDEQFKWEEWWLQWHESRHGKLPLHNRIGGRRR
jgi:hypothetical protein